MSLNAFKLDKAELSVILSKERDDLENTRFWLSKSSEERWAAIEFLRQIAYGYDPTTTRLQRILTITEYERD